MATKTKTSSSTLLTEIVTEGGKVRTLSLSDVNLAPLISNVETAANEAKSKWVIVADYALKHLMVDGVDKDNKPVRKMNIKVVVETCLAMGKTPASAASIATHIGKLVDNPELLAAARSNDPNVTMRMVRNYGAKRQANPSLTQAAKLDKALATAAAIGFNLKVNDSPYTLENFLSDARTQWERYVEENTEREAKRAALKATVDQAKANGQIESPSIAGN